MEKKNPNRFTIGFKKDKPSHQKVVDILNNVSDKAEFIAVAVLRYVGEDDEYAMADIGVESLQPLIKELVQQEVQKAVGEMKVPQKQETPQVMDLTAEEPISIDAEIAENMFSAMDAFRKI